MKICVIDDNVDILELLKNVLEATGNGVFTADNGNDWLSLITSDKFELTILDIYLTPLSRSSLLTDFHPFPDQGITNSVALALSLSCTNAYSRCRHFTLR